MSDKTYIARISMIDEMKSSRNGGAFKRIYFQVKDPIKSTPENKVYFWAKTDLVPSYRNYKRWSEHLRKGNIFDNLILRKDNTIDADSFPNFLGNREEEPEIAPLQKSLFK